MTWITSTQTEEDARRYLASAPALKLHRQQLIREQLLELLPYTKRWNGSTRSDQVIEFFVSDELVCRSEGGARSYTPKFAELTQDLLKELA